MTAAGRALALVRLTAGDLRPATVELTAGDHWSADPGPGRTGRPDRPAGVDVHWSVDPDARRDGRWAETADVLRCGRPAPGPAAAARRARWLLARHPGCLLASVPDATGCWVIGLRDGRLLTASPRPPVPAGAVGPVGAVLASFLHGWLTAGRALEELGAVRLSGAGTSLRLRLRALAAGGPGPLPWAAGPGRAGDAVPPGG
ncbi:hypothetical protein AF335_06305 [Streptomyces eurocidicus]|uniref:Uncharacterized protein n=1 Tax=Streptomyces eurocidicus TaxID=66423 RepID=A0A2N8NZQ4_STREU|nr:hypothetical protein [Streptomyces eurocidicus]MBB5118741.1 hypothetical protein [Streptomyces eurocidicus]MBF6051448.1 hypothetical protein [Streptomyces eurocidicus]PNE34251.1 hypothetical protein AF335_06305 [Streptomyces eurocidicus]